MIPTFVFVYSLTLRDLGPSRSHRPGVVAVVHMPAISALRV